MTVIATVLRSGGDFLAEHAQQLHRQFGQYPSVCLSDLDVAGVKTLPLHSEWPGWFAKMELFNPAQIDDDILYFDLDTRITGDISYYLSGTVFRMLSDFYYPNHPASGMMFIPHSAKSAIWNAWIREPERWMATCRGDQNVLESICGCDVARFDDSVKSYKVHVACKGMPGYLRSHSNGSGVIPPGTAVLCFHGYPRPWDVDL